MLAVLSNKNQIRKKRPPHGIAISISIAAIMNTSAYERLEKLASFHCLKMDFLDLAVVANGPRCG